MKPNQEIKQTHNPKSSKLWPHLTNKRNPIHRNLQTFQSYQTPSWKSKMPNSQKLQKCSLERERERDLYLGSAVVSGSLPNVEKSSIRPNQFQHIIGDQSIIKQKMSTLNHSHSLQCQKLRVPRPSPHQIHIPRSTAPPSSITSSTLPLLPQHSKHLLKLWKLQSNVILPH